MNAKSDLTREGFGLLANGSSGSWEVAVNESPGHGECSLELEGPNIYLVFPLPDLKAVPAALSFLRAGPPSDKARPQHARNDSGAALTLGRFGSAVVSLVWDNEGFPRCFLLIGPRSRSTLRLSLDAEDIEMLVDALRQVVEDLRILPNEGDDRPTGSECRRSGPSRSRAPLPPPA